jgi:hypothetical protein
MSAFINVVWAKKLKNFPQPDIGRRQDTWADADFCGMEVDLPKDIVELTPWFSDETHVDACVGVPE